MAERELRSALGPIYDAATNSNRWLDARDALNMGVGAHATALLVRERDDPLVPYEVSAMGSRYREWIVSGRADNYFTHLHHHEAFDFETVKRTPVHELLHDIDMGTEREVIDRRPDYVYLREEVGFAAASA